MPWSAIWPGWRLLWTAFELGAPAAAILILVSFFYVMKWIPPVPLSMQFGGIYYGVQKQDNTYVLTYQKPPWTRFWRHDSRDFLARPGDAVYCFVRVFAPRRFTHQVYLRWSLQDASTGRYAFQDRMALPIHGGRGEGFRGYGVKSNYQPGRWRVTAETEDGRSIGEVPLTITPDTDTQPRTWRELRM